MKIFIYFTLFMYLYYITRKHILDLRFYKKNNWNFDINNPKALLFMNGEFDERPISNKNRVVFSYPFMIAIGVIGLLATYNLD